MAEDEVIERWTANRKAALVLDLLKGKRTLADACREYNLKQSEVEEWMERFVQGETNRLKSRPQDEQALFEERERQESLLLCGTGALGPLLEWDHPAWIHHQTRLRMAEVDPDRALPSLC